MNQFSKEIQDLDIFEDDNKKKQGQDTTKQAKFFKDDEIYDPEHDFLYENKKKRKRQKRNTFIYLDELEFEKINLNLSFEDLRVSEMHGKLKKRNKQARKQNEKYQIQEQTQQSAKDVKIVKDSVYYEHLASAKCIQNMKSTQLINQKYLNTWKLTNNLKNVNVEGNDQLEENFMKNLNITNTHLLKGIKTMEELHQKRKQFLKVRDDTGQITPINQPRPRNQQKFIIIDDTESIHGDKNRGQENQNPIPTPIKQVKTDKQTQTEEKEFVDFTVQTEDLSELDWMDKFLRIKVSSSTTTNQKLPKTIERYLAGMLHLKKQPAEDKILQFIQLIPKRSSIVSAYPRACYSFLMNLH